MDQARNIALPWPAALQRPHMRAVLWVDEHRSILPTTWGLRQLPASDAVDAFTLVVLGLVVLVSFLLTTTRLLRSSSPSSAPSRKDPISTVPKRKPGPRTVLLAGPSDTGKTAVFSALVYGTVPQTHTSQVDATGWTVLGQPEPLVSSGEGGARHGDQYDQEEEKRPLSAPGPAPTSIPRSTAVQLIDTPGHPRLRGRAHDFLEQADALVFCVDATLAARAANATTASPPGSALADAVDFFHATLTALATRRLRDEASSKTVPPSLMILFTRADLSPLLSAHPTEGDQRAKRRAQLLQRATAGFETELGWRRAALMTNRRTGGAGSAPGGVSKLSGIDEIQSGEDSASTSLWARFKALLGLSYSSSGSGRPSDYPAGVADDEADEFDYLDWAVSQRQAGSLSTATSGALPARVGLNQFDQDVVCGGRAHCGLASLGKRRSWSGHAEGKDDRDLRVFLTGL